MSRDVGIGEILLSDGSRLLLKILIINVRESPLDFMPFGGVNFNVDVVGGISIKELSNEVKGLIRDKPTMLVYPIDGWEIIPIKSHENAMAYTVVDSSNGKFSVKVSA